MDEWWKLEKTMNKITTDGKKILQSERTIITSVQTDTADNKMFSYGTQFTQCQCYHRTTKWSKADLQRSITEMHHNCSVSTKPFLHKHSSGWWYWWRAIVKRRLMLARINVSAIDEVFIHVLTEVDQKRHFLLEVQWNIVLCQAYHPVTEVIILQWPANIQFQC